MLSSSSTFPWRRRRGDLAGHGEGGRMKVCVRNHGGMEEMKEAERLKMKEKREFGEERESGSERVKSCVPK